jgi:hypothetical protein
VERRLEFIADRLTWEGRINRQDLVVRFGISPNQATADLKRFEALHPGALRYDTRAKTYRADSGLPVPGEQATGSLLRQFRLIAEGVWAPEDGSLALPPPTEIAEPPMRSVPPAVLAAVIKAIGERRAITATYQSFSGPTPERRFLEPHALVFDGFRWHARARDAASERYGDFVLGRMRDPELGGVCAADPDGDVEWRTRIALEIAPHPRLTPQQAIAIAADYGMTGNRLILRPRAALVSYVKRRLGLTDGHHQRDARDQHIVLISETRMS